jgi:hypothetical protein
MEIGVDWFVSEWPPDLPQLRPYFESPVEDALLQRWEVAPAAANQGEVAADLDRLLPYATIPEQQAALHKRIERSSGLREESTSQPFQFQRRESLSIAIVNNIDTTPLP